MYSQSLADSSQIPFFEDGFGMNSLRSSFFARITRTFFSNLRRLITVFYLQVPRRFMLPDHVPSLIPSGLGPVISVQILLMPVLKQGLLRWSCHLFCNAVSSPVPGASASVLSPNFQRFLESGPVTRNTPPPRVTVCQGTSTRDEVQHVDVAVNAVCDCSDASVDACVSSADKTVQVAVETSDAFSLYDPPVEPTPAASPSVADVLEMMQPVVDQPDLP